MRCCEPRFRVEVVSDRAQVVVTRDQVLARTRAGISHLSSRLRFGETLKAPQTRWAMTNIRECGVVVKEPDCTSGYHLHPGHAEWTQESWMRDCQVLKRYRACCAGGTFRAGSGRSTTARQFDGGVQGPGWGSNSQGRMPKSR